MNLTAIIVDDEESSSSFLKSLINKTHPEILIKDVCGSAKDALLSVIRHRPNLLFLDIEMPDMTGLEFFEKLSELRIPVQAIITTAHQQPAFLKRAVQLGFADYIVKPISAEDLDDAIANAVNRILAAFHLQQSQQVLEINQSDDRISLSTGSSRIYLKPSTIVYANSDGKFSKLFLTNLKEESVMIGIGELAELLPQTSFSKIDRFTIVNRHYVQKISPRLKLLVFEFNEKQIQLNVTHSGATQLLQIMESTIDPNFESTD